MVHCWGIVEAQVCVYAQLLTGPLWHYSSKSRALTQTSLLSPQLVLTPWRQEAEDWLTLLRYRVEMEAQLLTGSFWHTEGSEADCQLAHFSPPPSAHCFGWRLNLWLKPATTIWQGHQSTASFCQVGRENLFSVPWGYHSMEESNAPVLPLVGWKINFFLSQVESWKGGGCAVLTVIFKWSRQHYQKDFLWIGHPSYWFFGSGNWPFF